MRDEEQLGKGRFISLLRRDGWEYVRRSNTTAAVVLIAVTDRGAIILVEQYRPPVNGTVIELPAGLVGDELGKANEDLLSAARRELIEETGFDAETLDVVAYGPASAGIVDENVSLILARGLRRVGPGGGVDGEKIEVHQVPLPQVVQWLHDRFRAGQMIDPKVYAGLHFALADAPAAQGSH